MTGDETSSGMRLCAGDEEATVDDQRTGLCGWSVYWLDLDMGEECRRPVGHRGHHTDGLWWFDNNGLRVPVDPDVDGGA